MSPGAVDRAAVEARVEAAGNRVAGGGSAGDPADDTDPAPGGAFPGDDLEERPCVYSLSHKANGVIRQNIWSSLGVTFLLALGVPIGLVGVAAAVLVGDTGTSRGVTGNAMCLSRPKPERLH